MVDLALWAAHPLCMSNTHNRFGAVGLAMLMLASVFGTGCASTPGSVGGLRHGNAASLPEHPKEAVRIFDTQGRTTSWDQMIDALVDADVVVIGESHGHPLGLEAAALVFDDLLARTDHAALAMEFFERDTQVALDDYLTGVTDEATFEKAAHRSQGNYPPGHKRLIEAAKAAGRQVIAANAPRRYVHMARKQGYDALAKLTDEQKRLFVIPTVMPSGDYKDAFFEMMGGGMGTGDQVHSGMPPEMVEAIFRSQAMWDATMADSVYRATLSGNRPVVLVVGRFHADNEGGTIQLLKRLRPDLTIKTLSMVINTDQVMDEEDAGSADFIVYTGREGIDDLDDES